MAEATGDLGGSRAAESNTLLTSESHHKTNDEGVPLLVVMVLF